MIRRSLPYWLDRFPRSRRPTFPLYRGETETRVAIVGGGLAGCAAAAAFASARVPLVLLEADRIGAAATAGAPGLAPESCSASFRDTVSSHGLRAARSIWQDFRRASLELAAVLRRLRVRCDLEPTDLLHVCARDVGAQRRHRQEHQARRDAGLDHAWLSASALARDTAIGAGGAIRIHGSAFDPYRACLGLAAAAASRGAQVAEGSEVLRIRTSRRGVEVVTARGVVRADAVVVATGFPIPDLRALRRHLRPRQGYAVVTEPLAAAVRRELGRRAAAIRDDRDPPHLLRWLNEDRALFSGADQDPGAPRALERVLVQRTGQLMYELSTVYPAISGTQAAWSWAYDYDDTVDALPYIGPHRNFPHHLFALGLGRHGAGAAWLAARVLLRQFLGAPAKGDQFLGFARVL